jgi:hypothetical protein
MGELRLSIRLGAVSNPRPASLKVPTIRTRRDFTIGRLPREPHLKIVGFGGPKTHIPSHTGASYDREARVASQDPVSAFLVIFSSSSNEVSGRSDLYHLHLLELVLPNQSPNVSFPVRARLTSKAGRIGGEVKGELTRFNDLITNHIRERHLRRRNQKEFTVSDGRFKQVFFKLR